MSSSSNSSGGGSPDKKQQRPQRAQAITGAHHFANPQNVRRPHFQSEGKYSCTSNKNPRVGTGNNAGCLDGPNSPTICPESKEGLPSYPPFTDVGFFDGARLLIAKISHHSDRTGKQHQVSQLLEFVYHLPWKSKLRFFELYGERSDVDQRRTHGTKRHITRSRALIMIGSDLLTVDLWSELKYIFSAKSRQTFGCLRLAFPTKQRLRSSRNLDQPIVPMNHIRQSPSRFSKEGSTRHPSRPPGGMTWN